MNTKQGPNPVDRALRVFLCHSSGDKTTVRDLYRRLREDGFAPWLDEEDLVPGQEWRDEIPKAVRACDAVILCLSQESVTKEGYVQKEMRFALDIAEEKPEGTIFIIPVRLDEVFIPGRLSKYQSADLFNTNGYHQLLRALTIRAKAIGLIGFTSEAMYDLARKRSEAKDYAHAQYWYERAAEDGHADAMNALGILYNNALGVPRDYRRARQWHVKAAAAGSAAAMFNLGLSYENGRGVEKDLTAARNWYQKSANAGNNQAREKLRELMLTAAETPAKEAKGAVAAAPPTGSSTGSVIGSGSSKSRSEVKSASEGHQQQARPVEGTKSAKPAYPSTSRLDVAGAQPKWAKRVPDRPVLKRWLGVAVILMAAVIVFVYEQQKSGSPKDLAWFYVGLPCGSKNASLGSETLARTKALPGVVTTGMIDSLSANSPPSSLHLGAAQFQVQARSIMGDYFSAVKAHLSGGRFFNPDDDESRPPVAIVNRTLAKMTFPKGDEFDPVIYGTAVFLNASNVTLIGVVDDSAVSSGNPIVYIPALQAKNHTQDCQMYMVVRTAVDSRQISHSVSRSAELSGIEAIPVTSSGKSNNDPAK